MAALCSSSQDSSTNVSKASNLRIRSRWAFSPLIVAPFPILAFVLALVLAEAPGLSSATAFPVEEIVDRLHELRRENLSFFRTVIAQHLDASQHDPPPRFSFSSPSPPSALADAAAVAAQLSKEGFDEVMMSSRQQSLDDLNVFIGTSALLRSWYGSSGFLRDMVHWLPEMYAPHYSRKIQRIFSEAEGSRELIQALVDEKENDDSFLDEETLKFGAMLRGLEAEQDGNDDSDDESLSFVERMNAIRCG